MTRDDAIAHARFHALAAIKMRERAKDWPPGGDVSNQLMDASRLEECRRDAWTQLAEELS